MPPKRLQRSIWNTSFRFFSIICRLDKDGYCKGKGRKTVNNHDDNEVIRKFNKREGEG